MSHASRRSRGRCRPAVLRGDVRGIGSRRTWHEPDDQHPEQGRDREGVEVPLEPQLGSYGSYYVSSVYRGKDCSQPSETKRPTECGSPPVRRVVDGSVCVDEYGCTDGSQTGQGDEGVDCQQRQLYAQKRYTYRSNEERDRSDWFGTEPVRYETGEGCSEYGAEVEHQQERQGGAERVSRFSHYLR